jgi:hypothetical protein
MNERRGKLQVSFYGEEGIDAGGLTREWYSILAREMFNQVILRFCQTERERRGEGRGVL